MTALTAEDKIVITRESRAHKKNRMTLAIKDEKLKLWHGRYVKTATQRINHAMSMAKEPEWFEENPLHHRKVY